MDLDRIEQLVKIIENSSMLEFSIKEGDTEVFMSRKGAQGQATEVLNIQKSADVQPEELEEDCYITSPIVATFYSSPSPEAKAFVAVGDVVKAGQTVCILEAMKLMNEIECDFDCEIEAVLVSNEQKVEYGQPLFRVKKVQD